ncbi:MAG: phosphodiesterase, partial [Halanaerobiaceae bacterium]
GRIFLNVKGREPQGIVPENKYEYYRDKLTAELSRIKVEEAAGKVQNIIYRPEEIYQEINNIPPDLMVYFNNLEWRSIGNLGSGRYLVPVGDLKSYSANHTDRGIFISSNNRVKAEVITDVYSVILNWMR